MDPLLFKFLHDHRSLELEAERHHHTLARLAAANRPEGAQHPLQQWISRLFPALRPAPAGADPSAPAATTARRPRAGLTTQASATPRPVIGRPMGCVQ